MKNLLIMIVLLSFIKGFGQAIPTPSFFYDLSQAEVLNNGSNPIRIKPSLPTQSTVSLNLPVPPNTANPFAGTNRLGATGSSLTLNQLGYNSTALFQIQSSDFTALDAFEWGLAQDAASEISTYTIACWIYVDPTEVIERMILNSATGSSVGLAVSHTGKSLSIYRYVESNGTSYKRTIDNPVAFNKDIGWYFLCVVQTPYSSRVFIGSKNSDPSIDVFACNYQFLGYQSQQNYVEWGLGANNSSDSLQSVMRIDDLSIWNLALSPKQVNQLYLCSKNSNPNPSCWNNSNPNGGARIAYSKPDTIHVNADELVNQLSVFPNPNHGSFTVEVTVTGDTPIEFSLMTIQGVMILQKQDQLAEGVHRYDIKDLEVSCSCAGVSAGMYLLTVKTNQISETKKIIIQ